VVEEAEVGLELEVELATDMELAKDAELVLGLEKVHKGFVEATQAYETIVRRAVARGFYTTALMEEMQGDLTTILREEHSILSQLDDLRQQQVYIAVELHLEVDRYPVCDNVYEYPKVPPIVFIRRVLDRARVSDDASLFSILQQGEDLTLEQDISKLKEVASFIYVHIIRKQLLELPRREVVSTRGLTGLQIDGVCKIVEGYKKLTFFGGDGELQEVNGRMVLAVECKEYDVITLTQAEKEEWGTFLGQHLLSQPPKRSRTGGVYEQDVLELIKSNQTTIEAWVTMTQNRIVIDGRDSEN
jgi:hypothetical protein